MPPVGALGRPRLPMFRWVALAVLLPLGCSPSKIDLAISIEPASAARLKELPGAIGITLRVYEDRQVRGKSYVMSRGRVIEAEKLPAAPKHSNSMGVGPYGVTMLPLPESPDFLYQGPYLVSPDKNKAVATIAYKKSRWMRPTSYVVGDLSGKKLTTVRRDEELSVDAIAWSPDSKYVALLRSKQVSVLHGPMEILSSCAGHPVQYSDYFLEVIDAEGNPVVSAKLLGPITGSWGEIVWEQEASNSTVESDAHKSGARGSP